MGLRELHRRRTLGGGASAPNLSSATIYGNAKTDIVMVFTEVVTGTNLGFTISGTTSTTFASISGSGTNTITGTMASPATGSETILLSYDAGTGDIENGSSVALASITNFPVTLFIFLFDDYSNALFGYSLQNLRYSQTYGIRVVRTSDSAETDVELYNDGSPINLSSTVSAGGTLGTWVSGGTAYVKIFYDQSGNGYDITTAGTGVYYVVESGVFNTYNSVNSMRSGFVTYFSRTALTEMADGNDITTFIVSASLNPTAIGGLIHTHTASASSLGIVHDRRTQKRGILVQASTSAFADLDAQYDNSNVWQQTSFIDGTNKDASHWKDGTAGGQNQAWTGTYSNSTFRVGNFAGNYLVGHLFEVIGFSDDKTGSRTAIEANQVSRYNL